MEISFHHALHGADWRWRLAEKIAAGDGPRPGDLEYRASLHDSLVRQAAAFWRLQSQGAESLLLHHGAGAVAEAFELEQKIDTSDLLKLYVLAGAPVEHIAEKCAISTELLTLWEQLFFDVRQLLTRLSVVAHVVVQRAIHEGRQALAARMKLARAGGVVMVDVLQRIDCSRYLSEAEKLYDLQIRLDVKANEALLLPIANESQRVRFAENYLKHKQATERLAFARERFLKKCEIEIARLRISELATQKKAESSPTLTVIAEDAA